MRTIGKGRHFGNLYLLEKETSSSQISAYCSSITKTMLWHSRLGHPSFSRLQLLNHVLGLSSHDSMCSSIHCKVCHQAKQRKLVFPSNNNMADNVFDLVHMDVWGSFATSTTAGYRYFLTLVDDHSRATWVYLLHSKSDVETVFPTFYHFILT